MTELILHVGERLAALDQERGVGVPEVVEADPTEPRLLEQGQPDAMHEVQGVDRPVDPIREYPRREITALNGGLGLEKRFPPLERSRERGGAHWSPRTSPWRIPVHAANAIRSSHSGYHRLQALRRVASSDGLSSACRSRAHRLP